MSSDLHTLSGAYALDALTPDEAAAFRKHLEACPACQQEVFELRAAAAQMGASQTATPPIELRQRIMAAADRQPQLPPLVDRSPVSTGAEEPEEVRRPRPRWFPRLAAAAAVAVIAGVGVTQLTEEEPQTQLATPVVRVFEANDADTATVPTKNGGSVSVAVSRSLGKVAVDSHRLPELNRGRVYQMWTIAGDDVESAGIVKTDRGATMPLPGTGSQVAITVEPAGGSERPTTSPIVAVKPSRV